MTTTRRWKMLKAPVSHVTAHDTVVLAVQVQMLPVAISERKERNRGRAEQMVAERRSTLALRHRRYPGKPFACSGPGAILLYDSCHGVKVLLISPRPTFVNGQVYAKIQTLRKILLVGLDNMFGPLLPPCSGHKYNSH